MKYVIATYKPRYDNVSDIIGLSLPTSNTVYNCNSTITFLEGLNTKIDALANMNVVTDLNFLLENFYHMLGYMKIVQSSVGTTYTLGDIANQSWYNDLEQMLELPLSIALT